MNSKLALHETDEQLTHSTQLTDLIPTPVFTIDTDFTITYINPLAASIVAKSVSECLGEKCYNLFKTNDCQTPNCACAKAMKERSEATSKTVAKPLPHLAIPISYTGRPLFDQESKVIGAVESVFDMSETYKVAKQLQEVQKILGPLSSSLSESANSMASNAEELTAQVGDVSNALSSINSHVKGLATLSQSASNDVNTVAASAEEMSVTMQGVSSAMKDMSSSVHEISKAAQKGGEISSKAVKQSDNVNQSMRSLISTAKNIGDFVQTIDGIASQTNMLALNATIEASRAGEAGKGFAVVASEVKSLAKQTTATTIDISKKIKEMQQSAENSNDLITQILNFLSSIQQQNQSNAASTEEQNSVVMAINSTVVDTEKVIAEVAKGAVYLKNAITEIDSSSQEIKQNVGIVSENMTGVKAAGSDVGKAAINLSKQSEQLASVIGELQKTVEQFTLLSQLK